MHHICILGTGYVGLVTGACFAELGHPVTCVDVDTARIQSLRSGRVPFFEPGLQELVERNAGLGRLTFSSDYGESVPDAEIIFLCLPTPPTSTGAADTSILRSAVTSLAPLLDGAPVIVNKSTAPVGTTEGLRRHLHMLRPAIELTPVVSNPEFLREGSAISDFMNPDRVVIGAEDGSVAARVRELYEPLGTHVLVTDVRTAEMIKYASNSFLATKISFINEVADICEEVGADVSLVAEGMGLDRRIGKAFLRPGVGYGGSCFPKDVLALAHIASMRGVQPLLLRAVMEVNSLRFKRVLHKLRVQMEDLEGATIAVWGIAYKPNTDDIREAPAVEIMQLLEQEGAHVRAYDPVAMPRAARQLPYVAMCESAYEAARGADAVLLLTEWSEFKSLDLDQIAASMRTPVLIDGRNLIDPRKAVDAGFAYMGIGRAQVEKKRRSTIRQLRRAG